METKKSKKASLGNRKLLFREVGMVVALLVVLVAFEWPSREKQQASLLDDDRIVVAEEEMVAIEEPEAPQPSAALNPPQLIIDVIEITDDPVVPEFSVLTEETSDPVPYKDYIGGTGYGSEPVVEEEFLFYSVEEKPRFMGGDENDFTKWVYEHLVYIESAKEAGVQGRILVEFAIAADGRVTDVKILRGLDPALDKEVLRVMALAPKWEPGKQRGKPVRVKFVYPVIFQLQ